MKNKEEKLFLLTKYLPVVLGHVFYWVIGIINYLEIGLQGAMDFLLVVYLPQMIVFWIFKYRILVSLINNSFKDSKDFYNLILLILIGLGASVVINIGILNIPDSAPLYMAIIFWLVTVLLGLTLVFMNTFTSYYYDLKIAGFMKETERVKLELKVLKNQINPHFLFNTMNNIYGLVQLNDTRAPSMISRLSKIMRYLLYDCSGPRVSLNNERKLIEDYLHLQFIKSEFIAKRVDFYNDGILDRHQIMPLLLINFIENCFKHGDIETDDSGWIKISLEVVDDVLLFHTQNTFSPRRLNPDHKGIGLSNAEKMLKVEYDTEFELERKVEENIFMINLKLKLV